MTSRYPSQHGASAFGLRLSDDELLLPELLKQQGYVTAAFFANAHISENSGFARGVDRFVSLQPRADPGLFYKQRGEGLQKAALEWHDSLPAAAGPRRPVFLFKAARRPNWGLIAPGPVLPRPVAGELWVGYRAGYLDDQIDDASAEIMNRPAPPKETT